MKKSGGTGKTKGKTKAVKAVKRKEDTGSHAHTRRGTNPMVILIVLPLVLGAGGFLAWYYHQHGHLPLFVTEAQRNETMRNAQATWDKIQQTTLDKWKTTKEELAKLEKKYSAEYDEYIKNKEAKQRETEKFLEEMNKPAPAPAQPARPQPVRVVATQMTPVVTRPAAPTPPPTPTGTPGAGTTNGGTTQPAGGTQDPVKPADPVKPVDDTTRPVPPTPPGPETTQPVPPEPAPVPKYNLTEDTNYKNGVKKYDAAFDASQKADSAEGEDAIKGYKEAITLINAAQSSWQLAVETAAQKGIPYDGVVTSINSCKQNAQVWQDNIKSLEEAAKAPPPAVEDNSGGSAAMGTSTAGFYPAHPKWNEGKKYFQEGYEIFTKNVGGNTGQDSHTLNKYIDQAVEKFNKAQECWDAAEADWNKKYPGNKGPKSDLDMMDKAQGEAQFYRYACMKMHTFER